MRALSNKPSRKEALLNTLCPGRYLDLLKRVDEVPAYGAPLVKENAPYLLTTHPGAHILRTMIAYQVGGVRWNP